jgi:hypothetical protein
MAKRASEKDQHTELRQPFDSALNEAGSGKMPPAQKKKTIIQGLELVM